MPRPRVTRLSANAMRWSAYCAIPSSPLRRLRPPWRLPAASGALRRSLIQRSPPCWLICNPHSCSAMPASSMSGLALSSSARAPTIRILSANQRCSLIALLAISRWTIRDQYPYDALQQVHLGHMLSRRSGLYQHCQTHLAGFLSDAQGDNASLRAARIDARRADNVARAAQEQLAARRQSDDVGNTTAAFVALARAKSLGESLLTEVAKFSDLTIRILPNLPHQEKTSDNKYRACTEDRLTLVVKKGTTVGEATAIADKANNESDVRLKALAGEQRDLAVQVATTSDGTERAVSQGILLVKAR